MGSHADNRGDSGDSVSVAKITAYGTVGAAIIGLIGTIVTLMLNHSSTNPPGPSPAPIAPTRAAIAPTPDISGTWVDLGNAVWQLNTINNGQNLKCSWGGGTGPHASLRGACGPDVTANGTTYSGSISVIEGPGPPIPGTIQVKIISPVPPKRLEVTTTTQYWSTTFPLVPPPA